MSLAQDYWRSAETRDVTEGIATIVETLHVSIPCQHTRSLIEPYPQFEIAREEERDGAWVCDVQDKISWLTIFGEEGLRRHGREGLLTAPVWSTGEVSETDISLIRTESPRDHDAYARTYNDVRSHLGIDSIPRATVGE